MLPLKVILRWGELSMCEKTYIVKTTIDVRYSFLYDLFSNRISEEVEEYKLELRKQLHKECDERYYKLLKE